MHTLIGRIIKGGEHRDFPLPEEVDSSLEFLKCTKKNIAPKYWNMSDSPLPKNQH